MVAKRWRDFEPGALDERVVTGERPKRHKYGAVPTEVDGIRFASKKEARRYQELRLLEKAGEIAALELQPRFALIAVPVSDQPTLKRGDSVCMVGRALGVKVGEYRADFRYTERGRGDIVEDVKGVRTPVYRLKKKMVEAQYGIEIREV